MSIQNFNVEWLNQNSLRRYPLADDAEGVDETGNFQLPSDFLVELDLTIAAALEVDPSRFFVSRIDAYAIGYAVIFGYMQIDGTTRQDVATTLIPTQAFANGARNVTFGLTGVGNFADTVGKVIIGSIASIANQPPGSWTFSLSKGRLDPDSIRPALRGISSITIVNAGQVGIPIYHDVALVAGTNCRITLANEAEQVPVIKIGFIKGEGTIQDCECYGEAAPTKPITSINGIRGDFGDNFTLEGVDCLSFEPIPGGLKAVNTCAKPCCGSSELKDILADLERLKAEIATGTGILNQVAVTANTFSAYVLGSKIGDAPCGRG